MSRICLFVSKDCDKCHWLMKEYGEIIKKHGCKIFDLTTPEGLAEYHFLDLAVVEPKLPALYVTEENTEGNTQSFVIDGAINCTLWLVGKKNIQKKEL